MKNPNRDTISKLEEVPNIGVKIAEFLYLVEIHHPKQLIGQSTIDLYMQVCEAKKEHVDRCVIDVFMSAIDFMEGSEAKPWWTYTEHRKALHQTKYGADNINPLLSNYLI